MNERLMNLDDLDKYGQNLITYSDYVNDSMNKIAAGFNNLYAAKIIQGRRSKVFIDVYNEMDESRKNVVDKLYEVKEFVDTVRTAMQNLDADQAKKLQTSLDEMGIKRGKGGTSGGGSTSGGSEGGGTAPTRTTTEEDEQRVQNELGKTSTEGTTGKGEDTTQNNSSESEPKPTSNQEVVEETSGDNTSPSTPGSNEQTVPGENLGQGEGLSKTSTEQVPSENTDDKNLSTNDKLSQLSGFATNESKYYIEKNRIEGLDIPDSQYWETWELTPQQKREKAQNYIYSQDQALRETHGGSWTTFERGTAEELLNNFKSKNEDLNSSQYNNTPILTKPRSGESYKDINEFYNQTGKYSLKYMNDSEFNKLNNLNKGLILKQHMRVDGVDYTMSVETDHIPTNREWNEAKIGFLEKISKPNSIVENRGVDCSFFDLDLNKRLSQYSQPSILGGK